MDYRTHNPANGKDVKTYNQTTDDELAEIVNKSGLAYKEWKKFSIRDRAKLFLSLANNLENNKTKHAETITLEMGKPISQAVAEIKKCALVCRYYANNSEQFLKDEEREMNTEKSIISFEPIGVIYGIMPWNFPYWQVFRYAAPTLMAGNTTILKHAENVPKCALMITELFRESGFPKDIFQTIFIDHEQSNQLIGFDEIKAITLTGSDRAGSMVSSVAGKNIKKTVLELGGSDPFIVLEDADIDKAVEVGMKARMQNTGQSCIAAKRFIIHESVADEYFDKFVNAVKQLKIGDPTNAENYMGPMARKDLRDKLEDQLFESVNNGAEVLTGGKVYGDEGYFFEPTVITNIEKNMPAYNEEVFGPVASLFKVDSDDEAIALANDSKYGLGASVWTNDISKAKIIAREIESGTVAINGMVKSDPRMPFGGIKSSGFGRELSDFGILEFVNIKSINIF